MDHRGVFLVLSFLLALIGCVVGFLPSTPKVFRRQHQLAMTVAPSDTFALFFDCDGVIVETEELHRLAYNKAFNTFGLRMPDGSPVEWDVPYYDILQNTVGGGKPKMKYHFNNETKAWPE